MALTYKLNLEILQVDLHPKFQVHMSVCSSVSTRHTDTDTCKHTHTMPKLLHRLLMWGVKIRKEARTFVPVLCYVTYITS